MKKICGIALGLALFGSQFAVGSNAVFAAEGTGSVSSQRVITSQGDNGETEVAVSVDFGALDGENIKQTKAMSATGSISGANPLFGKPHATATTKANKKVYMVSAQLSVNNNGQSTINGSTTTLNNTTQVTTAKLTASTERATFYGTHKARETASSSLYSASTQYTF